MKIRRGCILTWVALDVNGYIAYLAIPSVHLAVTLPLFEKLALNELLLDLLLHICITFSRFCEPVSHVVLDETVCMEEELQKEYVILAKLQLLHSPIVHAHRCEGSADFAGGLRLC